MLRGPHKALVDTKLPMTKAKFDRKEINSAVS